MKIDKEGWVVNNGLTNFTTGQTPSQSGLLKPDNVKYIVAHWTGGSRFDGAMAWLSNPAAKASAHFVVGRGGEIGQLVSVLKTAWHAGESSWRLPVPDSTTNHSGTTITGINKYSIGIEFVNLGRIKKNEAGQFMSSTGKLVDAHQVICSEEDKKYYQVFTEEQIEAGLELMLAIKEFYPGIIELIGHSDIAPKRKIDPGPEFPFTYLRARLFGRADEDTETIA